MMDDYPRYEGRYAASQPDELDYAPTIGPEDLDPHYVEARPRRDHEGFALILLECGQCGWRQVVTDSEGGNDFATPWRLMEIARRHYLALTAGHVVSANEIEAYGLQRRALEARGVIVA